MFWRAGDADGETKESFEEKASFEEEGNVGEAEIRASKKDAPCELLQQFGNDAGVGNAVQLFAERWVFEDESPPTE